MAEHAQSAAVPTLGGAPLTLAQARAVALEGADYAPGQYGDAALAIVAGQFPRNASSQAYESVRLVKGGAATCYGFSGYSSRASAQYVLLFDIPNLSGLVAGAVPVVIVAVTAASNFSYNPGNSGRRFLQGLVIANSTTSPTDTAGAADTFYDEQYV